MYRFASVPQPPTPQFDKFFSLEEAAGTLKEAELAIKEAQRELAGLYEDMVLYKRMGTLRQVQGNKKEDLEAIDELLEAKVKAFEDAHEKWLHHFKEQGIWLRDIEKGLINFPYKAADGEVFLLVWHPGEEGIFYFHEVNKGFNARKPITLLPD